MLQAAEGMRSARHMVTPFEQRLIERLSVVSDEHIELSQVYGKPRQHGPLVRIIAQEELAETEACGIYRPDADQECASAGGQAGGFGVEKGPSARRRVRYQSSRERLQQVGGKVG